MHLISRFSYQHAPSLTIVYHLNGWITHVYMVYTLWQTYMEAPPFMMIYTGTTMKIAVATSENLGNLQQYQNGMDGITHLTKTYFAYATSWSKRQIVVRTP